MRIRKMRFWLFILLAVVLFFVQGCANNNALKALNETRMPYAGQPELSTDVERIMEIVFTETGVPWDPATAAQVASARSSLLAIKARMVNRTMISSNISYYTARAAIEDVYVEYMNLQDGLDTRLHIKGALTDQGRELYIRIRQDINQELDKLMVILAAEIDKVNSAATKADMDDLKNVYTTLKPLLGTAKGMFL